MAEEFAWSVQLGLQLAKRIYYGKQGSPPPTLAMERKSETSMYMPTGLMVYAVITEPWTVDNPDIPSYQPYVHGRCDPPALIPLHMHGIELEVDCYLDTAFVTMSGTWRVHCVASSKTCDCRIAVPMGEQGSVLGVEVECPTRSYTTQLVTLEDTKNADKPKDGFLMKRQIYTLKVPQVGGGSSISVKVRWSQKLQYEENQFCLRVPFSFQPYVIPVGMKICKRERILLNVNCSVGLEILCGSGSHPLKEVRRQAGMLGFSYEKEVSKWSKNDFSFIYSVSSHDIFGSVFFQSPPLHDFDQRDMVCLYLYPGNANTRKVFRKEIVFIVDISASMKGGPLESVKSAVVSALSKLNPSDSFNIIAFNGNSFLFSPSMELASKEATETAVQWINRNFTAEGGTNILLPISQALKLMQKSSDSISLVFLITDGTVEDEKDICDLVKGQLTAGDLSSPRICTFGIGSYCNHYFLQALAQIGRGYYDAAFDVGSINLRLGGLFNQAFSIILADISISSIGNLDSLELYPLNLPDLSSGSPLIVSGRYAGRLPDTVKVEGTLADLGKFSINAKVQNRKDIPMERVFAKRQIDVLTANAWLSGSKQLEEKIAATSLQAGVPSEYTNMILVETKNQQPASKLDAVSEMGEKSLKKIIILHSLGLGFGSLKATIDNLPPETAEPKLHGTSEMILKVASNLCSRVLDRCCCMCFIQFCGQLNDRCAVVSAQLCTALACCECINFCCELCDSCIG